MTDDLLLHNARIATLAADAEQPYGLIDDAAISVRSEKITRTALIFIGPALAETDFRDSALYDGAHPHILRPKKKKKPKVA